LGVYYQQRHLPSPFIGNTGVGHQYKEFACPPHAGSFGGVPPLKINRHVPNMPVDRFFFQPVVLTAADHPKIENNPQPPQSMSW
jgi:hypothetical protein